MNKTILTLIALLLTGCTTTEQAMQRANAYFVGKNIDNFVLVHGIPYAKHQLNNGGFIYLWSSGVISYEMPATTSFSGHVSPYGHYSGTATTHGGGSMNFYCEVQIHTTSDGTIIAIKPLKDTWGIWTTSRCAEIFKETRNTSASNIKSLANKKTYGSTGQHRLNFQNNSNTSESETELKPDPQVDTSGRKIIGWRVDTSRKDETGHFVKTPVYEDEQKK